MNNKMNYKLYVLSLLLPAFIFAGSLILVHNYPFGDGSFTVWDMKLQYLDFFSWLKRVFDGEASLFYSFGKSLGDNTIGLVAYYLSSPFNLILFFFEDIQLFVVVVTTLKIACCGLNCSVFLKKRFGQMDSVWNVLLASSYALMAYNLDQSSNIMWLDGAVFLPLMMLGVYRMVNKEKRGLLYVSVILAILSNWYTAYMSCLFSALYYLYEKLIHENFRFKNLFKRYLMPFIRYCLVMILAVGTTMAFFLPTIMNLLQGKGAADMAGSGFRCTVKELIAGLVPGQIQFINTSVLILYCGSLTVIGIILYFFTRKIRIKEKIVSACFLVFLVFSAIWIPLENIWNGFRKVSSYYCRFTFIICFFMIYLAASYFCLKKLNGKRKWAGILVAVLVLGELFYNTYTVMDKMNSDNAGVYNDYADEAKEQIAYLNEYDTESFYRVEQTTSRGIREENYLGTYNEGMAYGFSPLASYSSTYNSSIMNFYVKCGYSECNRLIMYHEPMMVSDSLIGIKYLLSDTEQLGYEEIEDSPTYNQKKTYQNPYALDLGYVVNRAVLKEIKAENSFEYQNQLLSKMLGEEVQVYKPVETELIQKEDEWIWTMESPKCENILYGYLTRRGANSVDIYIDEQFRTYYSQWTSYKTFQIADTDNGETHTVSMKGTIVNTDGIKGVIYYLDMAEFEKAISKLKEKEFQPTVFEDGYVEGTYVADKKCRLLLTIPYDKGWTVICNGKEIEPKVAQDIFMVLTLKKGENHIILKYVTPGLKEGLVVTGASLGLFLLWYVMSKRYKGERICYQS